MKFSRYTSLFTDEKHGHLLYNSLTNSFLKLDRAGHEEILRIRDAPELIDFCKDPAFFMQLAIAKVIVDDGEEESLLRVMHLNRLRNRFDNKSLHLTIAPTLDCNFNCPYCYEKNRAKVSMDDEVEDLLVNFIKRHTPLRYINITWYGGEPLLCFERMTSMTEKIKSLDIPYVSSMVTNGSLLSSRVISTLAELKIRDIQITIDGDRETHDRRRVLRGGGKTYDRIVANMDALLAVWDGRLCIRVNIDKGNKDQFHRVHDLFMRKYRGGNVAVVPGFVTAAGGELGNGCQYSRDDAVAFWVEQYREHGIRDLSFFPKPCDSGCIATKQNGFIIGPAGEVYSCWRDIGMAEKVVGSIRPDIPWDMGRIANYVVGADPFDDPECAACFYLPVCDGGCPELRLRKQFMGEQIENRTYACSYFKGRLPELLAIYHEIKHSEAVLGEREG